MGTSLFATRGHKQHFHLLAMLHHDLTRVLQHNNPWVYLSGKFNMSYLRKGLALVHQGYTRDFCQLGLAALDVVHDSLSKHLQ